MHYMCGGGLNVQNVCRGLTVCVEGEGGEGEFLKVRHRSGGVGGQGH